MYYNKSLLFKGHIKPSGQGELYTLTNKKVAEVNCINGKLDGKCIFYHDNNIIRLIATFKDDKVCGYGTEYYSNGNKRYQGFWDNSKFNGDGTMYYKSGKVFFTGIWNYGFTVTGSMYYESGNMMYNGSFRKSKRNGIGSQYNDDDNNTLEFMGIFKNDEYYTGNFYKDGKLICCFKSGKPYLGLN
jgi:antitoxin component YwqK of YwqJK toxin-antitoxin module